METESFVQVGHGRPLTMTGTPRFHTIGLGNDATTTDLCYTLKAGELPDNDEERAPVDIIVALDKSGSMQSRGKLDLCKKTLVELLRQLLPQDRFGLITFSHNSYITIPIQRMTADHKAAATKAIKNLKAGGGTNMSSAVGLSAQEIRTIDEPNPVQSVFFLTDGHANTGISHVDGLVELVTNCFASSIPGDHPEFTVDAGLLDSISLQQNQSNIATTAMRGFGFGSPSTQKANTAADAKLSAEKLSAPPKSISMHCFGYGSDHNATLLRRMSSATEGGSYYYIEEDKDVGKAFGDALGGVMSMVAQNATITLEVPPLAKASGVEITKVHHDQVIKRENGSYSVTLGDFYAEETRDLVLTVKLAVPTQSTQELIPHVTATLSYTDTLESCLVNGGKVGISIARPEGNSISEENSHVAAQSFRIFAAKEMEEAEAMASAGNFREAKSKFAAISVVAGSSTLAGTTQASEINADAELMSNYMDNETEYHSKGRFLLSTKVRGHKAQRAAVSSAETASATYKQSKKRASVASKFSIK
eukprot:CAMPEP_0172450458 /NCGR_PEP_ID=MMETSP1065-20121228/8779_1 /TAXON_ID=265537 /ORGANISM="Amphiprora paludosa, Strain CCMP125" /LENGTH=533 /DNA_ID=CAMNT_0013202239 /DNA_START=1 /DNA_END=1602 /DNA_ORIENTATION=+